MVIYIIKEIQELSIGNIQTPGEFKLILVYVSLSSTVNKKEYMFPYIKYLFWTPFKYNILNTLDRCIHFQSYVIVYYKFLQYKIRPYKILYSPYNKK